MRRAGIIFASVTAMMRLAAANAEPVPVTAGHPIIGRWHLELFGGECNEDVEFKDDGTRLVTAGAQKLRASFKIAAVPDTQGFYEISDTILSTNDLPDCAGRKLPVGDKATGYVTFNEAKDRLYACNEVDMTTCWGPYVRNEGIRAELTLQSGTGEARN